jgi:hypothetical protein
MTQPGIRRELKPFGGINGQAAWLRAKEEAMRTKSRQYCFDHGFITAKDLDDEELVAGRCRDQSGRIPRTPGKTELIPRHLYDEMVAEHELRFKQKLRENLNKMLDVMVDIANDDTVEPRDRFEAAKYLFERTAGKTPETVTVNVKHAPWEELLAQVSGIAPMTRAEHQALQIGIVDAEVIEDGEEEAQADQAHAFGEESGSDADPDVRMGSTAYPAVERPDAPAVPATGTVEDDGMYWTEGDVPSNVPPVHSTEPYQDHPEANHGRRADEKRSYQQQVQDAQALMKRRKEARAKIQNAKKQRKITRALGADAITSEITGVTMDEDGKVKFVEE